jgi:hypothetical protein
MAPLARAYVRDTRPVAITEVTCTLGCDPEFAGHIPYLQHAKCLLAFQRAIADVIGRKVTVHVAPLESSQTGPMPTDVHIPADRKPHPDSADETKTGNLPEAAPELSAKRKWAEDPAVKRTMELFNGRISDVRE